MRPIDADALDVEQINDYYAGSCRTEDVQDWLDDQPALDVEPVRHGRWVKQGWGVYRCSCCKNEYGGHGADGWHYCPNCGAKMGAKEE